MPLPFCCCIEVSLAAPNCVSAQAASCNAICPPCPSSHHLAHNPQICRSSRHAEGWDEQVRDQAPGARQRQRATAVWPRGPASDRSFIPLRSGPAAPAASCRCCAAASRHAPCCASCACQSAQPQRRHRQQLPSALRLTARAGLLVCESVWLAVHKLCRAVCWWAPLLHEKQAVAAQALAPGVTTTRPRL